MELILHMFGRFRVYLEQFFEQRIEEISISAQKDNVVIIGLKEELRAHERAIVSKLDEEGQRAFLAYESAQSGAEALIRAKLYKQAFFDGMKAVRIFSK